LSAPLRARRLDEFTLDGDAVSQATFPAIDQGVNLALIEGSKYGQRKIPEA
jgi:hypothetical protein